MVCSLLEQRVPFCYDIVNANICVFSCSDFTITDQQPSPLDTSANLTIAEKVAGEWTFTEVCKPVEFYNVLLHRPVGTFYVI